MPMINAKYVPVLRPKKGELDAWLESSSATRTATLPLFEIHKPDYDYEKGQYKKTLLDHIDYVADGIEKKVGGDQFLFDLPPELLAFSKAKTSPITHWHARVQAKGVESYPVARLDHDAAARTAIQGITNVTSIA